MNQPTLAVIVPSKNRPENARRLLHAVNETAGDRLEKLVFAIDPGEEKEAGYHGVIPEGEYPKLWDWAEVVRVFAQPQRIGPILNVLGPQYAQSHDYVGFMGDDHLPRTVDWDELLIDALEGRPGVAYGNDLLQGENLPTACVVDSRLIRSLGYMVPPGLEHLYFDDFWKLLGASTRLAYRKDVIIEHLHPTVGKGDWDASYFQSNDPSQFAKDEVVYREFLTGRWFDDLADLQVELGA